jgi:hypothetical protein
MKTWVLSAVSVLLAVTAGSASAEVKSLIQHTPGACVRAGELPLLQVTTDGEGELRGYFRRINTTDWCSVEGVNEGPLSRVVLPKFESGDEIEYFFVLIDGMRVISRSAQIYRTRVTAQCDTAWARHLTRLTMNCSEEAQAIPAALGAGFLIGDVTDGNPPYASPDRPNRP